MRISDWSSYVCSSDLFVDGGAECAARRSCRRDHPFRRVRPHATPTRAARMNILLVLIPVTVLVVAVAVWLFFWAVNHQQFEDLDSPAELPLMEDRKSTRLNSSP